MDFAGNPVGVQHLPPKPNFPLNPIKDPIAFWLHRPTQVNIEKIREMSIGQRKNPADLSSLAKNDNPRESKPNATNR